MKGFSASPNYTIAQGAYELLCPILNDRLYCQKRLSVYFHCPSPCIVHIHRNLLPGPELHVPLRQQRTIPAVLHLGDGVHDLLLHSHQLIYAPVNFLVQLRQSVVSVRVPGALYRFPIVPSRDRGQPVPGLLLRPQQGVDLPVQLPATFEPCFCGHSDRLFSSFSFFRQSFSYRYWISLPVALSAA